MRVCKGGMQYALFVRSLQESDLVFCANLCIEQVSSALRHHEEQVRRMMVAGEELEGPAVRGNAQDTVAALVVFNSTMARDDCLRDHAWVCGSAASARARAHSWMRVRDNFVLS